MVENKEQFENNVPFIEGDVEHYVNNSNEYVTRTYMKRLLGISLTSFKKLFQGRIRAVRNVSGYWLVHYQDCIIVARELKQKRLSFELGAE
jgi:hypothetical protein